MANRAVPPPRSILVIGEPPLAPMIGNQLDRRGFAPRVVIDPRDALAQFRADGADLVVLCLPIAGGGARAALSALLATDPHLKIVTCGQDEDLPTAADAFEMGAFEHVSDPDRDLDALLSAVGVALGSRRGDRHLGHLREREAASARLDRFVSRDPVMQNVLHIVKQLCRRTSHGSPPTVLLTGETGTGKGLLARTIHYNGARRSRPLVEVNCAALPGNLLESELFGHERGAFTDARSTRIGLFETAHGGTLFLDEISALPLELQPKLLTALEEKSIRRVGGRHTMHIDVQVIAAAQPTLRRSVANGTFRSDLYHRLNVVSIEIPPLRERAEDKLLLAESFVRELCREHGVPTRELAHDARVAIAAHTWPGNVRELRNQLERILLLSSSPVIRAADFERGSLPAVVEVERRESGVRLKLPPDGVALDALEREAIREALSRSGGNVTSAAKFLRVSRQTLIYRMRKYGFAKSGAG